MVARAFWYGLREEASTYEEVSAGYEGKGSWEGRYPLGSPRRGGSRCWNK
jgi:hypothetical protein